MLSAAILIAACAVLYHLLRDIDMEKVSGALEATPVSSIVLAGALVAASYFTLTFYDYFALRTLGVRHIPYRVAGATGVLAYTIGHGIGFTVFTAGVVRFRVYSAWRLGLMDVAKIAFITGLTFWLGNAVMLGLGVAYAPETAGAITHLPAWINRALALGVLAVVALYLAWLWPRPRTVGRNGWRVVLPNTRLTLVQIVIGIADLTLAALAMYVLVSVHSTVDPASFIVAFVTASLLGFASHTPGGVGVFDTAIILALPEVERESLLASLLIFRALYSAAPFCIALMALGLREVVLQARKPPAS